uniref:Uncharacterized protein n=1 Tax=Oryza glaberrima TaxID=4538 RepID=I1PFM7_ORYGL
AARRGKPGRSEQRRRGASSPPPRSIRGPVNFLLQSWYGECTKMLAKVNESGIKDTSVNRSTSGFQQDANYEFSNRALQHGYSVPGPVFEEKSFSAAQEFVQNSHQFDHFLRPFRPGQCEGMQMPNDSLDITQRSILSNASCLDHAEEITSYDTDGYDDRTISFGSSCSTIPASYPYISPLQRNHLISDTRDCTWTALMQESLEASNSNNGLNEDCSDLTFMKVLLVLTKRLN